MAPPPQPAEKSRAGRKALAAIRGGGGLGAKGGRANVLEQVISRTRPKYLPPKALIEDQKHLKEFDEMMTASLEIQKRKRELENEKKLAREKLLASYQPTWEKEILPNWKSVLRRDDASGRALSRMWWLGTMPPRHRGRLWHQCIGNAGAVGRSAFVKSVALANSLINSNPARFPVEVLRSIDDEISKTLPKLKLFQVGGPMHTEFREVLLAWSVFWREQPYYPTGSSHVAAMFLINMPPADAFLSLVNVTRKSCLSYFYNLRHQEMEAFYRIFETLLSERMPKVFRNFERRGIRPETYLKPWLRSLYAAHLPLQLATRIIDVFVLEGDSFLFRVALAVLQILEARLLNPDREEIEMVFRGEDRGARAIVARDTMSVYGERKLEEISTEEAYEEMGCHEENVFEALDHLNWNEVLWERLVSRELPD